MSDLLVGTTAGPWQVNGCRGKVVHGNSTLPYHGVGPDGTEVAAVWFDKETGLGWNDAKLIALAPTLATENAALRSLCAELVGALTAWDEWEGRLINDKSAWSSAEAIGIPAALFDDYLGGPQMLRARALARSKELLP